LKNRLKDNDLEKVYIGIGSNLEPDKNMAGGLSELYRLLTDHRCSSLYRTEPVGKTDQPDFFNAVVVGLTSLSPLKLLEKLHQIERRYGRDRTGQRWGPRTLDLDILLFGKRILNEQDLVVPHPEIKNRTFVLIPLTELEPGIMDPKSGRTFLSFLEQLPSGGVYRIGPCH
jgi:2-amino-4-hydroxy-6-hydroxymethyldihydropteridine diphosphokinase